VVCGLVVSVEYRIDIFAGVGYKDNVVPVVSDFFHVYVGGNQGFVAQGGPGGGVVEVAG
jgi:hypothetical protein